MSQVSQAFDVFPGQTVQWSSVARRPDKNAPKGDNARGSCNEGTSMFSVLGEAHARVQSFYSSSFARLSL